ncbi:DUF4760 domain-containing protein [Vibrio crassostreae]|uniref:hypothetical protein n=1 Tax=Vibrio TaxID=662 RepID=UPI0006317809|nr:MULTISPECIES: hypothetical protein [Vibrio]TCO01026.1 hypothetical protein EDB30_1093 [Vibrio crassostreae]CAK1776672.1 DUF4760 domain-containing protein [Vibrio crassostreae]CAK1910097.1 DUF4760 domain-containing protein [Vibrio crassostreae]CAK1910593.1 DUF4760 domain-containing protein [Vibrio crassostreae]CAK2315115.1 DUF4760 domain-containing protein [Vibrio crassostreae]
MEYLKAFWSWLSADGIAAFITAIGLICTIKSFNKQQKLVVFMDYTKRYQEICINLPDNINEADFSFDDLDSDEKKKTLRYMRAYFDLCSEEYHLYLQSHIDKSTWCEWQSGIRHSFSKRSFQDAWVILGLDTVYYSDFSELVNKTLEEHT